MKAKGGTAHLQQEHVLGTIGAVDGQLARPLLAGDDRQLGGECCDGDDGGAGDVRPRHSQLEALQHDWN